MGPTQEPLTEPDRQQTIDRLRRLVASTDRLNPTSAELPDGLGRACPPASEILAASTSAELPPDQVSGRIAAAHEQALRWLTSRARSRQELRLALSARGFTDAVVTVVLERLERVGLIDDAAFARQWVSERRDRRGASQRQLMSELSRRGISAELITAVLAEETSSDLETAMAWGRRRAALARKANQAQFERRLATWLVRRGYSSGIVQRVVLQLREEANLPSLAVDQAEADGPSFVSNG
jgi:regulatory protein